MNGRRLIGGFLALTMLLAAAGCGMQTEGNLVERLALEEQSREEGPWEGTVLESLPEGTAALELVEIGQNEAGYYMDCLPHDADSALLLEGLCRLPLAEDVWISYYPMGVDGSSGESYGGAEYVYSTYQSYGEELEGIWFWTYSFNDDGALCELSDEVPWELIVEEHPIEDFYGCWDYSGSFWQPGLGMYNVPGEPPCGDYIVLHEDGTADVYHMEEKTVYVAAWELRERSAWIDALDICLSFTSAGLKDSRGHSAQQGTPPASDGLEWVDLT